MAEAMQSRLKGTIVFSLIGLAISVGVMVWREAARDEPKYQGKPVSYWLENWPSSSGNSTAAGRALEAIGPTAAPFYVRVVQHKDSWLRRSYNQGWLSCLDRLPPPFSKWLPEHTSLNSKRRLALLALGTFCVGATNAIPALIEALRDEDSHVQAAALYALRRVDPKSTQAIAAVTRYLKAHRRDAYTGLTAAVSLWHLDPAQVPLIVACLTDMLTQNQQFVFDAHVLDFLRQLGPAAKEALPLLERGRQSESNEEYRQIIAEVIARISARGERR